MLHLTNQFEQLYFLQTHKNYLEAFEKQLDVITRTITLTNDEVPNLEIITFSELKEIQNELLSDYDKNTLMTYDSLHPFEILQSTKLGIISINNLIVMALKVPILNPTYYNISRIYPIPNQDSIALINTPTQYYLENGMENRWTDRCQSTIGLYRCKSFQLNKCDLQATTGCDLTKTSGAEAYKLISHGLLTTFSKPKEIIEKCENIVTRHSVTNNNIILFTCSIIIENNLITMNTNNTLDIPTTNTISYFNKEPGQSINLQSYHLDDISKLKNDLQPLREENFTLMLFKFFTAIQFMAQESYQKAVGQDFQLPMSQSYISRCTSEVRDLMVCDAYLNILNINARFPGSAHDAAIWQTSEYLNNAQERSYNEAHMSVRNVVERCIGMLKKRFRSIFKHRVLSYDPYRAAHIIYSCVILHNLCILMHDQLEDYHGTGGGPSQEITLTTIDSEIKELLGSRVEGNQSEFDGDANIATHDEPNDEWEISNTLNFDDIQFVPQEIVHENIEEVVPPAEVQLSLDHDYTVLPQAPLNSNISLATPKKNEGNESSDIYTWAKYTPKMLRTRKSQSLQISRSGAKIKQKEDKEVINDTVSQWAEAKSQLEESKNKYLHKEQQLKLQFMKEKHETEIKLMTANAELDMRLRQEEHNVKMEILEIQKRKMKQECQNTKY
ncbi:hypothetical protein NQ314_014117 [Rhamnusium bicolor]|uniref:DDE Tnp4 domain-containing protein n=1 Tax=Rhamnusium bicolor TaxID=1586634 RepID=A0AAV8X3F9_9CUCU|nr:hypothetical protein NQ314_014117 [Rhamnusium bicolor]